MTFDEVSEIIGRQAVTCRKLCSRARAHIHEARPRYTPTKKDGLELAAAFFSASRNGDMSALRTLLANDIVSYADGGGKVSAPISSTVGIDAVAKLFRALARYFAKCPSYMVRFVIIDGLPGFITIEGTNTVQTTALQIENEKVRAIYVMRNPEKLQHLADFTSCWKELRNGSHKYERINSAQLQRL